MNIVQRYFYGVMSILLISGTFLVCAENNGSRRKRVRHESPSCSPEPRNSVSTEKVPSPVVSSVSSDAVRITSVENLMDDCRLHCSEESGRNASVATTAAVVLGSVGSSVETETEDEDAYVPRSVSASMCSETSTPRSIHQDSQELEETQEDFRREYYVLNPVTGTWRAKTFKEWKAGL